MKYLVENSILTKESIIITLSSCCLILILLSPFSLANLAHAKMIRAPVLLTAQSHPFFLDCNKMTVGSNLLGLTANQSAEIAVTDGDTSTGIGGQALFQLEFRDGGIANNPGDEIVVYELTGVEPFNMSVFDSSSGGYTEIKTFSPKRTELSNSCGEKVNAARVDLSAFGIANGSSVSRLFFDNLGGASVDNTGATGCCSGAEISDIVLVEQSTVGLSFCLWLYSCK